MKHLIHHSILLASLSASFTLGATTGNAQEPFAKWNRPEQQLFTSKVRVRNHLVETPDQPFSTALRLNVEQPCENDWDVEIKVRSHTELREGDILVFRSHVKCNGPAAESISYSFQHLFGDYTIVSTQWVDLAEEWTPVNAVFSIPRHYDQGKVAVSIKIGYDEPQSVSLAPFDAVVYRNGTAPPEIVSEAIQAYSHLDTDENGSLPQIVPSQFHFFGAEFATCRGILPDDQGIPSGLEIAVGPSPSSTASTGISIAPQSPSASVKSLTFEVRSPTSGRLVIAPAPESIPQKEGSEDIQVSAGEDWQEVTFSVPESLASDERDWEIRILAGSPDQEIQFRKLALRQ